MRSSYSRGKRLDTDAQERHSVTALDDTGDRISASLTGNGTKEKVALEIPIGTITNPADGQDIEALANGHSNDPSNKIVRMTQPEKTRYKAKKGESGSQAPDDPTNRHLHTPKGQRVHLPTGASKGFAISSDKLAGAFEVREENGEVVIYTRARVVFGIAPTVGTPPAFTE